MARHRGASYQKKGLKEAIHIVSAFAARQRIVLGQVKVNEKSNEIVAIPALLDMMAIEGAIMTIDAMGCQRDIAKKIVDKKADYVLALKGVNGCQNPRKDGAAKKGRARLARIGTKYGDGCRLGEDWRSRWILFR
jgi:Transposase DDE domain